MDNSADGGPDQDWRGERARLAQFLDEMLGGLGRTERRRWGAVYVRGLLSTNERKSAARIATQLPDGEVQALQQFVGQSPLGIGAGARAARPAHGPGAAASSGLDRR